MREYAQGPMNGILGYTEDPLVSSDLKGDNRSSIFSAMDTLVVGGNLVKVISWYDNEWGYACRLADITAFVAERMSGRVTTDGAIWQRAGRQPAGARG
jgi:glyceraldehyde 3-phosphate dehydrogenase